MVITSRLLLAHLNHVSLALMGSVQAGWKQNKGNAKVEVSSKARRVKHSHSLGGYSIDICN